MKDKELLSMALNIGYLMLEYGGEIFRVEESIRRIGYAYGMRSVEVFAIPSSIIVTITPHRGDSLTQTKRIYERSTNLDRIDKLNHLCRRICAEAPPLIEIEEAIAAIENGKIYSFKIQMLAYVCISFIFTLFFGGNLADAMIALVIGAILKPVIYSLDTLKAGGFVNNIVAGCITAAIAMLAVHFNPAFHLDKIIIGPLMNLVPGIALTNSVRDFIAGDFMAGLMKMVEALLIATGIAIGVGISLTLMF